MILWKLVFIRQMFIVQKNSTKYHENLTNGLVADTRSLMEGQTGRRTWSTHKAFIFSPRKEGLTLLPVENLRVENKD
jgi:hypothetical protein